MFTHLVNPLNRLGSFCFHQLHLLCTQSCKSKKGKQGKKGKRLQDDREEVSAGQVHKKVNYYVSILNRCMFSVL